MACRLLRHIIWNNDGVLWTNAIVFEIQKFSWKCRKTAAILSQPQRVNH